MLMKQRLYDLLKKKWVSPITALNEANCFSLAQRVSNWRADGIVILDKWIDLPNGKRVKAYKLP
jgi:Helix-turn-helix domain